MFSSLLRKFWSFLKVIFRGAVELVLAQLREMAIEIVKDIAKNPSILTNEEKRKAAFERLKNDALDRGIAAKDSLINLAIELSVQFLKVRGEF